jgi:hypothetical protein
VISRQAAWSGYLVTAFAYAATLQNRILEHFGLPANTLEPISPIDHAAGAESSNLD